MNLSTTISVYAYGTSEGVQKAWDSRGRGRSKEREKREINWIRDPNANRWNKVAEIPISKIGLWRQNAPLSKEVINKYADKMQKGEEIRTPVVKKSGRSYKLLDGHHRIAAAKKLGLKTVHVVIAYSGKAPAGYEEKW